MTTKNPLNVILKKLLFRKYLDKYGLIDKAIKEQNKQTQI